MFASAQGHEGTSTVAYQFAFTLAFHIVFAVIGMAMPLLMVVSEGCYLWTKKPIYLELSKRWAAGTAIVRLSSRLRRTQRFLSEQC